jgi:signal transduction histidine kinase
MEAKYESAKKELEIERQQTIIEKQKMQHGLFVGCVVFCFIFIVLLWSMLRLRTRRNRVLSEMNATKDKFFSIISHDLKNPALAQRDALEMLLENAELWSAETLQKYYHGLLKSANSQVDLLYNLLNWAQVQTGRMPFHPVQFDLIAELRRTNLPLLHDMANRKGIAFITEIPDAALIIGDINMLTTVVRNLLTNALKFTNTGGTVTLTISPCTDAINRVSTGTINRVSSTHHTPHTAHRKLQTAYHISISDTGCGMTAEQVQNLLCDGGAARHGRDAARHVSTRGTAGEQGSGLGLIVCKELLEKHGSTLRIESKLNEGSRFTFDI